MAEAWIIDVVRTPTGKKKGALSGIRGDELATVPLRAVVERNGVDAAEVEDVIMGCVTPIGEQGWNIGRQVPLMAGFPLSVTGVTLNRMCGSGLQAMHWAAQGVMSGVHDMVIAAGVEAMSRVPMGSDGGDLSPVLRERSRSSPSTRRRIGLPASGASAAATSTSTAWRATAGPPAPGRRGASARRSSRHMGWLRMRRFARTPPLRRSTRSPHSSQMGRFTPATLHRSATAPQPP